MGTGYFRTLRVAPDGANLLPVTKGAQMKHSPRSTVFFSFVLCGLLLAGPAQSQNVEAESSRKAISKPAPEYPQLARQNGIKGTARVMVTILPDGSVTDVKELGGHPILLDALTKAVKTWKYEKSDKATHVEIRAGFGV
jgi:TonB family protein